MTDLNSITRKNLDGTNFELSIPRVAGVRSETVARITVNHGLFTYTLTKFARDMNGEERVMHGSNCRNYTTATGALKAAEKFLAAELAR